MKFEFTVNGKVYTVNATSKTTDSKGNYIWTGTRNVNVAGEFEVVAYSYLDGNWTTCDNGQTSIFVSDVKDSTIVSFDERRPSDEAIKLNATFEGYLPTVIDDPLVTYAPTLGHGKVIVAGEYFYNDISREEAYAYLVRTMNDGPYASAVNEFMDDYNIKFNQQQFDSLVLSVYNLGSGVLYNSDVKAILTDCYENQSSTSSTIAYVDSSIGLNLRKGSSTSYDIITLIPDDTKVTIIDVLSNGWCKVKLPDGQIGYCSANYLRFEESSVRNLNYVDKDALISELIQWHHAGGECIWGLLYRRIDELEIFFYNDYELSGRDNAYNMKHSSSCFV